jgi:hypothetical protein
MRSRARLFTTTALLESGAGVALLCLPWTVIHLLLGAEEPTTTAMLVARVMGLGLIALGVSAWLKKDERVEANTGLLSGLLTYNIAISIALAVAGTVGDRPGVLLWPVVLVHVAMAIWCVKCRCARAS